MAKTYSVYLSNHDCIFDSESGFTSVAAALDWASGRGGRYVVQIGPELDDDYEIDYAGCCPGITLSAYHGGNGSTCYEYYNGWEWRSVSIAEIEGMM